MRALVLAVLVAGCDVSFEPPALDALACGWAEGETWEAGAWCLRAECADPGCRIVAPGESACAVDTACRVVGPGGELTAFSTIGGGRGHDHAGAGR